MSSNGVEPQEECPICIRVFDVEFSRPESCQHRFHRPCIREWSKFKTDCPLCRVAYKRVFVYEQNGDTRKLITTDTYEAPETNPLESEDLLIGMNNAYDLTHCRICGGGDHEESILLCDDCDEGYHLWCLTPQLTEVPQDEWFCDECRVAHQRVEAPVLGHRGARIVRRTLREERVVNRIRSRIVSSEDESEGESDEIADNDDVPDFEEMDRMVLDGVVEDSGTNLPSISRKRKSKKKQKSPRKKRGVNPSSIRKRRRSTRKTSRRRSRKNDDGESSSKRERAEIPSLSVTGAGMPHFADEDDEGRQPESPPPMPQETHCDILGMIIEEQEKVLTPGSLLKIEGGKFEKADGFKEYQQDVHARMSDKLKVSLGMQESEGRDFGSVGSRDDHRDASPDCYRMDAEVQEQLHLMQQEQDEQLRELQMKALAQKRKDDFERAVLERRRDEQERREKERHDREQVKQQMLKEERRRKCERYEEKEREREERDRNRKREKTARDGEKKHSDKHRNESDRRRKEDDRSRMHKSSSNGRDRSRERRERNDKQKKSDQKNNRRPSPPPIPPPPMNAMVAPFGVPLNPLMGSALPSDVVNALFIQQLFGQQGTIFPAVSTSSVLPIPLPPGLPPSTSTSTSGAVQAPAASVDKPEPSKTLAKDEIVKRVEEIAKKYAKKYFDAKKIAADEYKTVMRKVVKDCAKKEILGKRQIYDKVKLAVSEVKRRK